MRHYLVLLAILAVFCAAQFIPNQTAAFMTTLAITAWVVWQREQLKNTSLLLQLCLAGTFYTYASSYNPNKDPAWEQTFYLWGIFLIIQTGILLGVKKSTWLLIINTLLFYLLYRLTQPTLEPSGILAVLLALIFILSCFHKYTTLPLKKYFTVFSIFFFLIGVTDLLSGPVSLLPKNALKTPVLQAHQLPIVFAPQYDITLFGIEKLHPYDSQKYGKVYQALLEQKLLQPESVVTAQLPSIEDLQLVHESKNLTGLKTAGTMARVTEIPFLAFFPDLVIHQKVGMPMLYATGGSIMAGELALQKGWAINLGGGYHHASAGKGGGFCAYADISLSIKHLQQKHPDIQNIMIIDLDAHQGNGHERDFMNDTNVFTVDLYNPHVYPRDDEARAGIDIRKELPEFTKDEGYLLVLQQSLDEAFSSFSPDVIYYIAGTDVLEHDPLGRLSVTPAGVIKRDEMVFSTARTHKVPVVMLLAGGYQKNNAEVITHSITNLYQQGLLSPP